MYNNSWNNVKRKHVRVVGFMYGTTHKPYIQTSLWKSYSHLTLKTIEGPVHPKIEWVMRSMIFVHVLYTLEQEPMPYIIIVCPFFLSRVGTHLSRIVWLGICKWKPSIGRNSFFMTRLWFIQESQFSYHLGNPILSTLLLY